MSTSPRVCPVCGGPLFQGWMDEDPWTHDSAGATFACELRARSRYEAAIRAGLGREGAERAARGVAPDAV